MKLLGMLGLGLALVLLLALVGHGARHGASHRLLFQQQAPIQIIRSPKAVQAPKTVRAVAKPTVAHARRAGS